MSGRLKKIVLLILAAALITGAGTIQKSLNHDRDTLGLTHVEGLTNAPPILAFTFAKGLYKSCGFIRYNLVMSHLLVMVGMLLKMVARWVFNLKYVVFMPEIFFNI